MNLKNNSYITKDKTTIFERKIVFNGQYIDVHRDILKNAFVAKFRYEYISRSDACIIIPRDKKKFYLIQEYRYPVDKFITQFPIETKEANESYLRCAKRGLMEELGLQARHWSLLGSFFVDPGLSTQRCQVYQATDLTKISNFKVKTEKIRLVTVDFNKVEKILGKSNAEAWSIAAWNLFKTIKK